MSGEGEEGESLVFGESNVNAGYARILDFGGPGAGVITRYGESDQERRVGGTR